MSFIWKFVIFLGIQDFTGCASAINTEFEIFLNVLFIVFYFNLNPVWEFHNWLPCTLNLIYKGKQLI